MIKTEHKDISRNIMDLSAVQGDSGFINITVDDYTLTSNDKIIFSLGDKENELLSKEASILSESTAEIHLTGNDLKLPEGQYYYDIRLIKADNDVDTIIRPSVFLILGKSGGESND